MRKSILIILCAAFVGILFFSNGIVTKYGNLQYFEESGDVNIDLDGGQQTETDFTKKEEKEEKEMEILKLTKENFEEEVLKSEKTVLVDFYADWCGPCKMMVPVVEKIASENQDLKVCKVNVDDEQELAVTYRVMSIPTFLVVKNGEVVNRIVGAVDKSELESAIK